MENINNHDHIAICEQGTVIEYYRYRSGVKVYTSNPRIIKLLMEKAALSRNYSIDCAKRRHGEIVSLSASCPKKILVYLADALGWKPGRHSKRHGSVRGNYSAGNKAWKRKGGENA